MDNRHFFQGAGCQLSAVEYGDNAAPDLILLHGMRDHALAMQEIAFAFPNHHIVAADLRGHGDSDNPGSYSMTQFVADLRALVDHFKLQHSVLVGHSLGGHICSKFASIYPGEVSKLVLIDGMGPPRIPGSENIHARIDSWRMHINNSLGLRTHGRVMADQAEALTRLQSNNPGLGPDLAATIVDHGLRAHPDGGVVWKWDPRVNMVWSTFHHDESEEMYPEIICPTLILTGDNSLAYWAETRAELTNQQQLHDTEVARRVNLFKNARHKVIEGAGHMLHYDAPRKLNDVLVDFIAPANP